MSWKNEYRASRPDAVIVIEVLDDTGFAYYEDPNGILGFVWLFNTSTAPEDWTRPREGEPPMNPRSYIKDIPFVVPGPEDVATGPFDEDNELFAVYVRGEITCPRRSRHETRLVHFSFRTE